MILVRSSIITGSSLCGSKVKPKVTIGVCVKNCEAFIEDAIESIIKQDFPHELMEVVFVDDGSEDLTLSIIREMVPRMDMSVKVYHQKWKGLGPARNVVVNNANGDYIVWVDGDMILSEDYVRRLVSFLDRNPEVGIGVGKACMQPTENLVAFLEIAGFMARDSRCKGITFKKYPGTAGSVYRIEALRKVKGFYERIKGAGEDLDVVYRIKEAGWLIYVGNEATFYARRKETWNALWAQYFWHGYGAHFVLHKDKGIEKIYEMIPPAAFLSGLLYSFTAYKLTRRKAVFLLPLHFLFKMTAWCFGFVKSHINGYEHL